MKKLIFLLAVSAFAQYPLQEAPYQAIYTANGVALPCSGCYLYSYQAGTTTPKATYTSSTLGVSMPNPIRTNSAGYAISGSGAITGVWVAAASCYHLVFKNASAVTVWDQDNLCSPASFTGAGTLTNVATGCGLTGGPITTTGTISETLLTAAHNGTYAILTGDCGKSLTTNTTAAWTIAQAGTTGFAAGKFWTANNIGSGSLTITATTSTFYGGSTANISGSVLTVPAYTSVKIFSDGTNYQVLAGGGGSVGVNSKTFAINGNGSAISTGALLVFSETETGGTIYKVLTTGTATSGPANCSITMDIWKKNAALPTSSDKISASAPATLSSAQLSTDTTLTGWSKTVAAGDIFSGSVATSSGCVSATIQIWWQ